MEYTGEYILEMKNIVKLFPGVRALDGMNLKIRPGKVHVIAGENGAGKSTLMKVINGDYVAEEGEVIYKGQKLGKKDDYGDDPNRNFHDQTGNEPNQTDDCCGEHLSGPGTAESKGICGF